MMDLELYSNSAMAESFERVHIDTESSAHTEEGSSSSSREGGGGGELGEIDIDKNLLKNLLESHAYALGMGGGPASQLLSQLGAVLPKPPPMGKEEDEK